MSKEKHSNDDFSKKPSLSPNIDELESLVTSSERISKLLNNLRYIEASHNTEIGKKLLENQFFERVKSSQFYQSAQATVEEVRAEFSQNYYVDIEFTQANQLKPGFKFSIRHGGTQHRHITPLAVVEKIISNTLKEGKPPEAICNSLLHSIELIINLNKNYLIKIDEKTNSYLQEIVDFFKNTENYTASGVSFLIKLAAHFYNQLPLVTNDKHIVIPYCTNNCYLVPTLFFGGEKRVHAQEGSFVAALNKIMIGFNQKIYTEGSSLKKIELKQMIYTIFAMFDFLPLPSSLSHSYLKKPKKDFDVNKLRYTGEPIERLEIFVSNHFLFIAEAYPNLWIKYQNQIMQGFLNYVSNGVSKAELSEIIESRDLSAMATKTQLSTNKLKENFTNNKPEGGGVVCGFAQQYPQIQNFYDSLLKKVIIIMKGRDHSYIIDHPLILKDSEIAEGYIEKESKPQEDKVQQGIESRGSEILSWLYRYDDKLESNFKNLDTKHQKLLGIKVQAFDTLFQKTFNTLISEYNIKATTNLNSFNEKLNYLKSHINTTEFNAYIERAIRIAYETLITNTLENKTDSEKQKILEELNITFRTITNLRHTNKDIWGFTPDSEEKFDFDYDPTEASPISPYKNQTREFSISTLSPYLGLSSSSYSSTSSTYLTTVASTSATTNRPTNQANEAFSDTPTPKKAKEIWEEKIKATQASERNTKKEQQELKRSSKTPDSSLTPFYHSPFEPSRVEGKQAKIPKEKPSLSYFSTNKKQ